MSWWVMLPTRIRIVIWRYFPLKIRDGFVQCFTFERKSNSSPNLHIFIQIFNGKFCIFPWFVPMIQRQSPVMTKSEHPRIRRLIKPLRLIIMAIWEKFLIGRIFTVIWILTRLFRIIQRRIILIVFIKAKIWDWTHNVNVALLLLIFISVHAVLLWSRHLQKAIFLIVRNYACVSVTEQYSFAFGLGFSLIIMTDIIGNLRFFVIAILAIGAVRVLIYGK